jgi:hypothetical protein
MISQSRTRIALYGDSLSLPRPGVVENGQRYFLRLHDHLQSRLGMAVDVLDRGEGATTISALKNRITHDKHYFRERGFLALLQSGIVDCAPRPVADATREKIGKLPSFIRKRVIKYLHNNRTKLILRRYYVRTELATFQKEYAACLEMLKKSYEHIFCINICPAPESFEKVSPGVTAQISAYNQAISAAASDAEVRLVDVHGMIRTGGDIYDYITREDDHHATSLTHEWITQNTLEQLGAEELPSNHPSKS